MRTQAGLVGMGELLSANIGGRDEYLRVGENRINDGF